MGQIPQHLERYASDELNDYQITDFVQCLQKAFTTFVQLTRGKDQNTYQPDEIRRFLQTYFLRERPITDKLMNEFMVIKQVLVGGDSSVITRLEIADLIEFLEDLRKEAIRIRPFVKYLNPSLIVQQDPTDIGKRLTEANETLRQSIRTITLRMQGGHKDYSFDNLQTLMTEFRGFVRWEDHFRNSKPVPAWIELFKNFKRVTTAQSPEMILKGEWAPFLQTFSRWYLAYIQFRVGVKDQPLLYGAGLQNTMHLSQELFELIEEAIHRQPGKVLRVELINALVSSAQKLDWISQRIRPESVERFTRALTDRFFADEKAQGGRSQADGLTLPVLALMRYEFYRWAAIQMKLESEFRMRGVPDLRQTRVPSLHQASPLIPRDIQAKLRSIRDADYSSFMQVKTHLRPMFNEDMNRVTITNDADFGRQRLTHGFHNLSAMNLLRSSIALLFRGYSDSKRWDWSSGLKSSQLQAFYEDVRDLAVDLKLADSRIANTGSRAFIEGNLFTSKGDGVKFNVEESQLSFVEAMELLGYIYSGGRLANNLYADLSWKDERRQMKNCEHGKLDENGEHKLKRSCVKEHLAAMVFQHAGGLPGMRHFISTAKDSDREAMITNILDSAFSPKNSEVDWVEKNELCIVAVVLHYLESVMIRFDSDRNGILTGPELRKAAPIFSGFIQRYAKDKKKQDLTVERAEGVFLFILAYKSIPESWLNKISVWWLGSDRYYEIPLYWFSVPLNWNTKISLNRSELSAVFRVIVAGLFETSPVAEQIRLLNNEAGPAQCQTLEQLAAGGCTLPGTQPSP